MQLFAQLIYESIMILSEIIFEPGQFAQAHDIHTLPR
jgi:hypothetical protein